MGTTRIALRAVGLGFSTLIISGIGHILGHPTRQVSSPAAELVTSIIVGDEALVSVPAEFSEWLGYQPMLEGTSLVNPRGGCSTPGGVGPVYFARACRTHDLGYDILRFAESDGSRLGPSARLNLDIRFLTDLLDTCQTAGCQALAAVYFTAVTANSIRQGYQAPTEEPAAPWIGLIVTIGGLATLTPPVRIRKGKESFGRKLGAARLSTSVWPAEQPAPNDQPLQASRP